MGRGFVENALIYLPRLLWEFVMEFEADEERDLEVVCMIWLLMEQVGHN
jgi:hypothetical protein